MIFLLAVKQPRRTDLERQLDPELFRALGDATRLEVLMRLATADGPTGVTGVADCCGVHLSGVSRHLAILRRAGIVRAHRRGREVLYELDGANLARTLRGLADALDSCPACCPKEKSK
jgi:ArsR family transcriptional regulator